VTEKPRGWAAMKERGKTVRKGKGAADSVGEEVRDGVSSEKRKKKPNTRQLPKKKKLEAEKNKTRALNQAKGKEREWGGAEQGKKKIKDVVPWEQTGKLGESKVNWGTVGD